MKAVENVFNGGVDGRKYSQDKDSVQELPSGQPPVGGLIAAFLNTEA